MCAFASNGSIEALEHEVTQQRKALERAQQDLAAAKEQAIDEQDETEQLEVAQQDQPGKKALQFGPLSVGGAVRVNYIRGSYTSDSDGPNRGGNGGDFELDTFRINLRLHHEKLIGALEYRWYTGYNFLHTAWLGYEFDDNTRIQGGLTRVPFGPGPYGVSKSWFFDQHYYLGLSDDMDIGVTWFSAAGNWFFDLGYFARSEPNGNGTSIDSARYGYDAVRWSSAIAADGSVVDAPTNGYDERNQFNFRGIYQLELAGIPSDLGLSLQYGQLEGHQVDNGDRWAASVHMLNTAWGFTLASQLTRYQTRIDEDNPWGTDALLPVGAYDFPWLNASEAWVPAVSLSYLHEFLQLGWLDSVTPYLEYSGVLKEERDFNDSHLLVLGAAWASGGWYTYTDFAYSNGNLFVGNDGDDFSNLYAGVSDFGVNANDRWNYRFNINFGYYF